MITAVVEGFAGLALVAGRLVPLALTLTTISAGIGMLHSAAEQAASDGGHLDRTRIGAALAVTALAVTAMAGTHHIRSRTAKDRARAVERAAGQARQAAEADRAHQLELQRAEVERAAQERQDAERFARAERAHELELQRSRAFAEQEQARLALEAERIRAAQDEARAAAAQARAVAEQQQAAAEQARAQTERQRAADEQRRAAAEQASRTAERERARAERQRAEYEQRLRDDRAFARAEWAERGWGADTLAAKIGVSSGRARALVAEWRSAAAEETAIGA